MINNNIYKDKIIYNIKMTEVGQVIRFDHRKGYGFINVLNSDSDNYGRELFFHFSEIKCENSFKKVFPNEIVSFNVTRKEGEERDVCTNIKGPFGATMMIDHPRYMFKITPKRVNNKSIHEDEPSSERGDEP